MGADGLSDPDIWFWAIWDGDTAVGCGALRWLQDGTAEVKSVHLTSAVRGQGLARRFMGHLAEIARREGATALVLETGSELLPAYDAARTLYLSLGYEVCDPIPGYVADPNSMFLQLPLDRVD